MATTITTTDPQALQVAAYMTSARQGKMAAQATEYGEAASASIEAETLSA